MRIVLTRNIGFILLAIYLFLVGITTFIDTILFPPYIYGIVAILSGIFILIGR